MSIQNCLDRLSKLIDITPEIKNVITNFKSEVETELTEKKNKKNKDPNAPKRALNSYMLFFSENRKKYNVEGKAASEITEIVKDVWNAEKEKFEKTGQSEVYQHYCELAKEKSEIWKNEVKQYNFAKPDSEKKPKKSKSFKPKIKSSWNNYRTSHHKTVKTQNPEFTLGQITRLLSENWKALSQDEKDAYKSDESDEEKEVDSVETENSKDSVKSVESNVEPNVDTSVEPKVEPNVDTSVEHNVEPKVESAPKKKKKVKNTEVPALLV
jgi:hypothetical protein